MSYRITFTDKYTGKTTTHVNRNNQADAEGWARSLAADNNSKAVCEHVVDGPYDHSGTVTHILSVGNNK